MFAYRVIVKIPKPGNPNRRLIQHFSSNRSATEYMHEAHNRGFAAYHDGVVEVCKRVDNALDTLSAYAT